MSSSVMNRMSMISRPCKWKSGTLYGQVPENSFADLACVRAGTKWVMNSAGVLVQRAANEPAVDYRGSTPAFNGLLIERAATNLHQRSAEFENAYWVKSNTTLVANSHTAPDGTLTADGFFETAVTNQFFLSRSLTISAGAAHILSCFIKANGRQNARLALINDSAPFDTAFVDVALTGAGSVTGFGTSGSATVSTYGILAYPDGWYWVWVGGTIGPTGTSLQSRIGIRQDGTGSIQYAGNASLGIVIWGGDLKPGLQISSHIPTTTISASRVADAYSKTGLSAYFNNTSREGTIYLALRRNLQLNAAELLSITQASGSTTNRLLLATTADDRIRAVVTNGGVDQADIQSGSNQSGVLHVAFAYKDNDCQLYVNGASVGTDTGVTIPSNLAELFLGGVNPTNNANYWMKLFAYAPERLTTAQIASLYTQLQNVA